MIIINTDQVPGKSISETLGIARGSTVRVSRYISKKLVKILIIKKLAKRGSLFAHTSNIIVTF